MCVTLDLLLPLPGILVQLYFLLEKWASQSASLGDYRTGDSHMVFAVTWPAQYLLLTSYSSGLFPGAATEQGGADKVSQGDPRTGPFQLRPKTMSPMACPIEVKGSYRIGAFASPPTNVASERLQIARFSSLPPSR